MIADDHLVRGGMYDPFVNTEQLLGIKLGTPF